ncbi:MAG: hypothetical protein FWC71_10555 [Defluviitaleaceae bacterium]|nr:hypothetical protein [Defluviitaleaceae bacterium]
MKKWFVKLKDKVPNADSNTFKIVMAIITVIGVVVGIILGILNLRFSNPSSVDYQQRYPMNYYSSDVNHEFVVDEAIKFDDSLNEIEAEEYSGVNESANFETPIIISENVVIMEGRTYRNEESQLTISPTSINSLIASVNITSYRQNTRSRSVRSGHVERFMFRERSFSITIDELNWSLNREDRNIIISIREYIR